MTMFMVPSLQCHSCKRGAAEHHVFNCVSCDKVIHLSEKCSGLWKIAIKEIGANLLFFVTVVATNRIDIVIKSITNQTSSQKIKAEFDDVKMAVEDLRESADTIPVKTNKGGERKDKLPHLTSTVKDLKKTNVCASC